MSSLRVVMGVIALSILIIGRGIWTATVVDPALRDVPRAVATPAVSDSRVADEFHLEGEDGLSGLDRYGNQIETAIGDYRLDPRGDVYERHSPDTALLTLDRPIG